MKRDYIKPAVQVCVLQQQCHILSASPKSEMNTLNSNFTNEEDELIYEGGSGGSFVAR